MQRFVREIQQNNKVACKTKSFHESVNLFALIMMLQVTTLYGTKIGKIHPRWVWRFPEVLTFTGDLFWMSAPEKRDCTLSSENRELTASTNPRLAWAELNLQSLVVVEQLWRILHLLDLLLEVRLDGCWFDGRLLLKDGTAHWCREGQHKTEKPNLTLRNCI